jgi:iron complex outermembrane receptor protein
MKRALLFFASAALTLRAQQQQSTPTTTPAPQKQTVVVTGAWEPVPLEESDRSVNVYPLQGKVLLFGDLGEAFSQDSSVQVQSRAPGGVQGDISIRGASFEQTVLLNGIRMSDAQSAHHTFDIAVPLDAIDQVEVLRGSGSTLYGSDAVGGVINILTRPIKTDNGTNLEMRLRLGYGTFGTNEQSGFLSFETGPWSQRLSFERELSDGFRDDREYRNLVYASDSWLRTKLGLTRVFLSNMDRPFGADQFYGPYNSWERTKTWVGTISQDLGPNTLFSLGYRRHTDLYELLRDDPAFYTNRHEDDTWDVALRRHDSLGKVAHVYYGGEYLADHVDSNNLGIHSRKQGAIYGDLDVRALRRFSFNVGVREEFYSQLTTSSGNIFIPSASAGYWLSSKIKLRGSVSRSFRLPNYTDLYYSDPADLGNPNLKPETAISFEGGADWHPATHWTASAAVFSRHERDDIDYVRTTPNDIWKATNFDRLTFTGVETSVTWKLTTTQIFDVQFTGLTGARGALGDLQSKYVFNYPVQQAVVGWEHVSERGWLARLHTGVTNQYARNAYVLVDAYGAWTRSFLHPYLRLTNLLNTDYQPFIGVPMPGRAALVGVEWCVVCKHD